MYIALHFQRSFILHGTVDSMKIVKRESQQHVQRFHQQTLFTYLAIFYIEMLAYIGLIVTCLAYLFTNSQFGKCDVLLFPFIFRQL